MAGVCLTDRERRVLELLADGHTQASIAHRLDVTDRTVRRITQNLFAKLGATTAAQAVALASSSRLLEARSWDEVVQRWRALGYQLALIPIRTA